MIFLELFGVFFLIGLFTFGGGYAMIPLIEAQVLSRGWISEAQLYDFIAVSEVTPGPFALNIATFIGSSQGGILGSILASLGVVLPSFIIIILLASILAKFAKSSYLKGAVNGVKPIVIALISSTVIFLIIKTCFFSGGSLKSPFSFDNKSFALFIMLLGFYFIYQYKNKKKLNVFLLILISAVCGIIVF